MNAGEANIKSRAIVLSSIGPEPVDTDISFDTIPLSREVLAGEYQLLLAEDGESVRAVHASWVRFAGLEPSAATGLLFRLDFELPLCPMLEDSNVGQVHRHT